MIPFNNFRHISKYFLICLLLIINISIGLAQELRQHQDKESLLDHLTEMTSSKLDLTVDLAALFSDRKYMNYKMGVASFKFGEEVWTDSIYVKTRGVYRNRKCDNPPLKLKYPKKTLKRRGLKKQNELKIVYPCKTGKNYQNYVFKEYLVYKMYNILTDKSLRVQLIDFTLNDVLKEESDIRSIGFLIEHREEIIKRLKAVKSDKRCIKPSHLSNYDYTLFQVFQFFIGNTDWLIPTCKNSQVITLKSGSMIPIPYDFDFSGMVDAAYAIPQSAFGLRTIKDRYFLGHEKKLEDLMPVFDLFKAKRTALRDLVANSDFLSEKEQKAMIKYMDSFYKILEKPNRVKRAFVHPMADTMKEDF